jgi:hypothetical protein
MTATVIFQFSDSEPFTLVKLNANFANLAAAVNALSADPLLQVGTVPGGAGNYMPQSGGQFQGQIGAPSMVVGPVGGTQHPVVTTGTLATVSDVGVVKQAPASADTAAAAGASYSQTQVQAMLDELRDLKTQLRTAGVLTP